MHNPRCPLVSDRVNEGLFQPGFEPSDSLRGDFIIAFGKALERDLPELFQIVRDVFSPVPVARRFPAGEWDQDTGFPPLLAAEPDRFRLTPTVNLPTNLISPLRSIADTNPLRQNRLVNSYFGALLCSERVVSWHKERSEYSGREWQIASWEIESGSDFQDLLQQPAGPRRQRRRPFLVSTLIRTWTILGLRELCGVPIDAAISKLRDDPVFWGKSNGERYDRQCFTRERGRICKVFPSGHEDQKYQLTSPAVAAS